MLISRRNFIHAGCAVAAANLTPNRAEAFWHGVAVSSANNNRVTMNVLNGSGYANYAKSFGFNVPPNIINSDGYPTVTPASNISCNPGLDSSYYGDYVWKWSGRASMQISGICLIRLTQLNGVTTGGVVSGVAGTSGDTQFNTIINDQTTPRVVFAFGALVQGMSDSLISNGAGGTYIKVTLKTGYVDELTGGTNPVKIQAQTGQANASGVWNWVRIDNTNLYLTTNTATGSPSAYNSGSPWASGGELITTGSNLAVYILAQGTFSSFAGLVVCKSANETLVDGGQMTDPALINQYKYLMNSASAPASQKGWLRFMDASGVQIAGGPSYECDFSQRLPASYMSYVAGQGAYFPPAYITSSANAAITNGGSDNYTCGDTSPTSVWTGSAYADLATVQGVLSGTNTGYNPTLAVGGHPAAPIFDASTHPKWLFMSAAPASAGLTMQWTFSASAWTNPQLNGGSTYTFTYTTVSGDVGNIDQFNLNLVAQLRADSALNAAGLRFEAVSATGQVIYARPATAGALTIAYTSGPAICTVGVLLPSWLQASTGTFTYSAILGGWIYRPGGNNASIPFEMIVEMCNQVGAHCWYNWPVYTKGSFITAVTNFFGDATTGLTSGLRFGTEVGNELWNPPLFSFGACEYLGYAMGFPRGSEAPQWGWGALRTIQYAALSRAAWTGKGRALADHYIFQIGRSAEAGIGQNFDGNGLQGAPLTTTNTIYATYGGLGGGAGTDYTSYPNRPVDIITATGMATYWFGPYFLETTGEIYGTVTDNANWLQASLDYANGSTALAFSELTSAMISSTVRPSFNTESLNHFGANQFPGFESMIAQYDAGRAAIVSPLFAPGQAKAGILHYEGGPQWCYNSSNISGTNGTSSADIAPLATAITNLGWNVSAYTKSGTNDATEMATQVVVATQAWKYDVSYKNMIKTNYYSALVAASASSGREVKPAQYGYQAVVWGLFPVDYQLGNQYTNYDAIHEFNA